MDIEPSSEPESDYKTEIERRWKALREAKLAKVQSGAGCATVNDSLITEECDRILGDRKGGVTAWER